MPAQGISVEGLNLLHRNLRKLDSDYPKRAKEIHQAIAEPIASRARSKARVKSGKMRSSIRPYATQRMARVGAGARTVYTGVQHYGWPAHNITPNLFLTESVNELQNETLVTYDRLMDAWIEEVWISNF